MKPPLPQACTPYDIRSPVFHFPDIRHSFAEQSVRCCLIKRLNAKKVVWILFIIHHFTI